MATKIVTKNSSTASAVPTASDLVQGELAVNVADKKLFTEDNSGAIIELADGVKLAGIEASADVTDTANVTAAGALMDSELTSEASVKALNQGVATTDSPAFAGLTVDTDTLAVDSTNNRVGIGTSSPSETLAVESTSNNAILLNSPANRYNAVGFQSAGVDKWWMGRADTDVIAGDAFFIGADAGNATDAGGTSAKLVIDSSGNVGIGTSSPSLPLHANGGTGNQIGLFESTDSTVKIGFKDSATTNNYSVTIGAVGDIMTFSSGSGGSERMRIDSSGNVGIGTTSPSEELELASSSPTIRLTDTDDSTYGSISYNVNALLLNGDNTIRCYTGDTERIRIDSSGNLLVGTTSTAPSTGGHALRIGANSYAFISHASSVASGNYYIGFRHGTSNIGAIVQNGTTGVLYNTSSDQRLKENIADADDAGSKIDAIQVRKYDWKADGSHQDYGMIAQELQTVAPEAVSGDADSEEMMGVDYSKLVPMLIKEIQSLRNRVAQLEE